jgi:hypothetical protein
MEGKRAAKGFPSKALCSEESSLSVIVKNYFTYKIDELA